MRTEREALKLLLPLLLLPPLAALSACKRKKAPPPPPPPPAAPAPAKAAAPQVSTATVVVSSPAAPAPPSVATYYKAERARDPFVVLAGAGGAPAVAMTQAIIVSTEGFNIHNLDLRGVLDAPSGKFALLVEPNLGATYVLKAGRLLDAKGKAVKGVSGKIEGRRVRLMTMDRDIQELKLGGSSP